MSGPKYSQFELERERQRQLELERQRRLEEEKKKKQLQQLIRQEEEKLNKLVEAMTQFMDKCILEVKANQMEDLLPYTKLLSQKEQTDEKVREFTIAFDKNSISQMEAQLKTLKNFQSNLKSDDHSKLNELAKQIEAELQLKKDFEKRQQVLDDLSEATVSKKRTFDISEITSSEKDSNETKETTINIQTVVEKAFEELAPYRQDITTNFFQDVERLYDSIRSIATNEIYDDEYKKSQIDLRMKTFLMSKEKYNEVLEMLAKERAEYEGLLIHYQSLCELLNNEENPLFLSVDLKNKEILKEEIKRLDQEHAEKQEIEYIVQSVHEVMEKLGYDILATDYMVKKKQNVHHHVYEFGFEEAVNVFVSDNGSILFEVTGIGEGQSEMTSLEKLKVTEAMQAFCTHYVDIREALKGKGIHLKNENLSPADERYARKIDISKKKLIKKRNQGSSVKGNKENRRSIPGQLQ